MSHRLEKKLQAASSAYEKGFSCVQAIFSAYVEELKISDEEYEQMVEAAKVCIGSDKECCGVITAASAILNCMNDEKAGLALSATNSSMQRITKIFQKEYGGVTCQEILKGCDLPRRCCEMKVKDMILIVEQLAGDKSWRDAS